MIEDERKKMKMTRKRSLEMMRKTTSDESCCFENRCDDNEANRDSASDVDAAKVFVDKHRLAVNEAVQI
jgi:hypothetical protein